MGVTHFDTAELYGPFVNEELLADAVGSRGNSVEIATKFGYQLEADKIAGLDSRPASVRSAVEGSFVGYAASTLTCCTSIDPIRTVPVEEVVGKMSDF